MGFISNMMSFASTCYEGRYSKRNETREMENKESKSNRDGKQDKE